MTSRNSLSGKETKAEQELARNLSFPEVFYLITAPCKTPSLTSLLFIEAFTILAKPMRKHITTDQKIHEITQHSTFLVNTMQWYNLIQPSTSTQVRKVSPLVKQCFLLLLASFVTRWSLHPNAT